MDFPTELAGIGSKYNAVLSSIWMKSFDVRHFVPFRVNGPALNTELLSFSWLIPCCENELYKRTT